MEPKTPVDVVVAFLRDHLTTTLKGRNNVVGPRGCITWCGSTIGNQLCDGKFALISSTGTGPRVCPCTSFDVLRNGLLRMDEAVLLDRWKVHVVKTFQVTRVGRIGLHDLASHTLQVQCCGMVVTDLKTIINGRCPRGHKMLEEPGIYIRYTLEDIAPARDRQQSLVLHLKDLVDASQKMIDSKRDKVAGLRQKLDMSLLDDVEKFHRRLEADLSVAKANQQQSLVAYLEALVNASQGKIDLMKHEMEKLAPELEPAMRNLEDVESLHEGLEKDLADARKLLTTL